MGNKFITKWILTAIIVLPLLFITQTTGLHTTSAVGNHASSTNTSKVAHKKVTNEEIKTNATAFMDILVQDTDNNNQVKNYDTKAGLIKAFDKVASQKVAKKFVNTYYEEQTDGLYVIPTETPAWFNENNDFNVIQLNQDQVKVVQHNFSDLHGTYTVELDFTYDAGWRITNVVYSD